MSSPPVPVLVDDLVERVLLLLPPDEPEHLARASLVCKSWRRILTEPGFRRRYCDSRSPPVLGLLRNHGTIEPDFIPTTAFRPPAPDHPGWIAMDCRHGRALFATSKGQWSNLLDLLVWDPLQRQQQRVPWTCRYLSRFHGFGAAVLCATRGCDHCSCQGGPFRIAIVYADYRKDATQACLYSSETGAWSDFTALHQPFACDEHENLPSLLVDDALYFTSIGHKLRTIIEGQLGTLRLSALEKPAMHKYKNGRLMTTEDGGLGFAAVDGTSLTLWSRETAVGWLKLRVIDLKLLVPAGGFFTDSWLRPAFVSGFAEGTDIIFVSSHVDLYMLELKSGRVKKMPGHSMKVFPYMSFYIPATESDSTHLGLCLPGAMNQYYSVWRTLDAGARASP